MYKNVQKKCSSFSAKLGGGNIYQDKKIVGCGRAKAKNLRALLKAKIANNAISINTAEQLFWSSVSYRCASACGFVWKPTAPLYSIYSPYYTV